MQQLEVYKCAESPMAVEILNPQCCCDKLECCGKPMELMKEKTGDQEGKEKHVPVIHEGKEGIKVEIGSVPHPMQDDHYIEWIEVINSPYVNRKYLMPGEAPEAEFYVPIQEGVVVRAYCNKHGLWRA